MISGKENSSNVIDFQEYKEKRLRKVVEIESTEDSTCPFCHAPTIVQKTSGGTDIHTYEGADMEAYYKLKALLASIVVYFRNSQDNITDEALIEVFGEGMRDFLKELADGK